MRDLPIIRGATLLNARIQRIFVRRRGQRARRRGRSSRASATSPSILRGWRSAPLPRARSRTGRRWSPPSSPRCATHPPESQLELIRAHPDLADRAAVADDAGSGAVAAESRREQAGAGLDRLTRDEFKRFADLNARYRARFGFPFIFAVKGANKDMILASFEERIGNDAATERATALANVERILRFRIEDRIAP